MFIKTLPKIKFNSNKLLKKINKYEQRLKNMCLDNITKELEIKCVLYKIYHFYVEMFNV